MQGKTVIVVAHRLSTIAHLDRILVFDQGRIVEDGTHNELLALGGSYHQLWSRQAGGFVLDDGAADKSARDEEPADPDVTPDEVVGSDRRRIQRRNLLTVGSADRAVSCVWAAGGRVASNVREARSAVWRRMFVRRGQPRGVERSQGAVSHGPGGQ